MYFPDLSSLIHTARAAEEAAASPNVATMFGLNMKLFLAQLFNFAIVLLVLGKWVFTPVTKALKARTEKIEQSLAHAEAVEASRAEFESWKKQSMTEARKEAADIVSSAKTEAEGLRAELIAKAKQEQEAVVQDGVERLKREQERMIVEAKAELAELVVSAAGKLLGEKMTDVKDKELAKKALTSL
jgi:F-type H+-transporting ATPase subunit b